LQVFLCKPTKTAEENDLVSATSLDEIIALYIAGRFSKNENQPALLMSLFIHLHKNNPNKLPKNNKYIDNYFIYSYNITIIYKQK